MSSSGWAAPPDAPPARKVVRTQDDLPRHSYPVPTSGVALYQADDATFNAWAQKVADDIDRTLASYQIDDPGTRRQLLSTRMAVELLTGRNEAVIRSAAEIRALEQKPDFKLTSGLREEAIARVRLASGQTSGAAFEAAYVDTYRRLLAPLPFAEVGTRLKETKGSFEINSPSVIQGVIVNDHEPEIRTRHALGDDAAAFMIRARAYRNVYWPLRDRAVAVLRDIIAANTVRKPDIWAARTVRLSPSDRLTPVTVAVWDTGVDTALFPGALFKPLASPRRGPGNGHGIGFDLEARPVAGVLHPLTARQKAEYNATVDDLQGIEDMQAAIDSPAAESLRAKLADMPPADAPHFMENFDLFADYSHGTHVAGIVMDGNPAARLAVIRETFYEGPNPPPPTEDYIQRRIAAYRDVADWIRANKVRVVNMSWIGTPAGYESALERHNIGKDAADRKRIARGYFNRVRDALKAVFDSNPATLFVSGAGNSNADNGFEEGYPSSIVAPNLLVASAVDQAGDETSFTSNGRNILVSANGYQVVSFMPGGKRIARSGTSMAAPNVANLAAKLIALRPSLSPTEVIGLIRAGAVSSADGRRHTINPRASVERLKEGGAHGGH